MSIWKRGTNLVKGMIAEASKSDDSEKLRALEKELAETAQKQSSLGQENPKPTIEQTLEKASNLQDGEEASGSENTEFQKDNSPQDSDKPLTPKKRTI